jgi:hypothetical protein
MMQCGSQAAPPATAARYFVSPFYDYGPVAIALGNFGLGAAAYAVQGCGGLLLARVQRIPLRAAFSAVRFPSIGRLAPVFLYQGVVVGGVAALRAGAQGSDTAWGSISLLLSLVFVGVDVLVMLRYVGPQAVPWWVGDDVRPRGWRRPFVGVMLWAPEDVRNRFGSLVGPYVPSRRWFFLQDVALQLCAAAMAASRPSSNATCDALFATLCALFLAAAAATVALRPYRRWPDTVLQCAKLLLMGLLNAVRVRTPLVGAAAGITMALGLLLTLRAGFLVVSQVVEAKLLPQPDTAGPSRDALEPARSKEDSGGVLWQRPPLTEDSTFDDAPTELKMALFDAAQADESIEETEEAAPTTTEPRLSLLWTPQLKSDLALIYEQLMANWEEDKAKRECSHEGSRQLDA